MPPRVNDSDVKDVFDTTIDTTRYIESAHRTIESTVTTTAYTAEELEELELYLAAHLAAFMGDPEAAKESVGDHSVTYRGAFDEGLKATSFGQWVLSLDKYDELYESQGGSVEFDTLL